MAKTKPLNNTRSLKDGNWYWIDKAIVQDYGRDIGALGIAVYNCLASFVDDKQTCYPSQARIGEMLGYSRQTINKTIGKLVLAGLISIERRSGTYPHIYRLLKV